jgi:hypothetical protein
LEISEGFSETIPANELKNPAGAIDTSLEHGRVTAADITDRNLEITDAKKLYLPGGFGRKWKIIPANQ